MPHSHAHLFVTPNPTAHPASLFLSYPPLQHPPLTNPSPASNRQLRIPSLPPHRLAPPLQHPPYIRPHHRHIPRVPADRDEEIAKQHADPVQLDQKAHERPAEEDQGYADDEGERAAPFRGAREEEEGFLRADY